MPASTIVHAGLQRGQHLTEGEAWFLQGQRYEVDRSGQAAGEGDGIVGRGTDLLQQLGNQAGDCGMAVTPDVR